jgi:hypothetical protein
MDTEHSITLTPSHQCVPALMDFIIDHAKPPYPARKEMAEVVSELGQARVRRLLICIKAGTWRVELMLTGHEHFNKVTGRAEDFDKALYNALNELRQKTPLSTTA